MKLHPALLHQSFCSVVPRAFSFPSLQSSDNTWLSSVGARVDLAQVTSHSHSLFYLKLEFVFVSVFILWVFATWSMSPCQAKLRNVFKQRIQRHQQSGYVLVPVFRLLNSLGLISSSRPHTVSSACPQQKRPCDTDAFSINHIFLY